MKHVIAFIVIGIVFGVLASTSVLGGKARTPIAAIIGGLLGGFVGGEIFRELTRTDLAMAKYGSLVISIVLAAVLAWAGRSVGARSS